MLDNDIVRLWKRRGIDVSSAKSDIVVPEVVKPPLTEEQKVLVNVYATDPLTNKPMNDLVLSANTRLNPTVREFIKQNLQAPIEPDKAASDYGISDELCRKSDESVFEYQQRLRQMSVDGVDYIKSASDKIKKAKVSAKSSK